MSFSVDSISLSCKVSSLATTFLFVPTKGWVYNKYHKNKTKGSQSLFSVDSISLSCKVTCLATILLFIPTKGWVYKNCHTSKTKGSQCLFQQTLFRFLVKYLQWWSMSFQQMFFVFLGKVSSFTTTLLFVPTKGCVYKKYHKNKTKGSQCLFQQTLFLFIACKVSSLATILFFVPNTI